MLKKMLFLGGMTAGVILSGAELVKDGAAVSGIIVDRAPVKSAQFAAAELQWHIRLITGADVQVTDDESKVSGTKIYVGESDGTRRMDLSSGGFENQEYLVRVKGNTIVLMGRDDPDSGKIDYKNGPVPDEFSELGTCYAVYEFLEKLGVRWYLPTDIGIVYDETKNLSVAEMDIRRKPYAIYRTHYTNDLIPEDFVGDIEINQIKNLPRRETMLFHLRQKGGGTKYNISHSFYGWYERFSRTHPEYFAQGYPLTGQINLCYSNPDVVRQIVQDARDFFDGKLETKYYPGLLADNSVFPIDPMDTTVFCKCDNCRKLLEKAAGRGRGQYSTDAASEYWFATVNLVAKELQKTHPGKRLGVLAYHAYAYPPKTFKLEKNVDIRFCQAIRDVYNLDWKRNELAILKEWQETNPDNIKSVWLYFCNPALSDKYQNCRGIPGFFADHIPEIFKNYFACNVRGFFYEPSYRKGINGNNTQGFLLDQLESYLYYKLIDHPELDGNVLVDEFFARYYGKAGDAMKKLYRGIQSAYCDPENYPKDGSLSYEATCWSKIGTPERMDQWGKFMEEARMLAASGKDIYRKRVEIFDNGIWKKQMLQGSSTFNKRKVVLNSTMKQATAPRIVNAEPGNPKTVDWKKAGVLGGAWQEKDGGKFNRDMEARACHDSRYFYFLLEDHIETAKLKKAQNWGDGCELFFGVRRGYPLRQICIGHSGDFDCLVYDILVTRDRWKSNVKVFSETSDPKVWRLYLAIPLEELGLKPGQMLYCNLLRNQNNKNEACWIPTFAGHIEPSRLGEIYLDE